MCKSAAEGGQRCASHARAKLDKASLKVRELLASNTVQVADTEEYMAADQAWEDAAVEYASTPQGEKEFNSQVIRAALNGDIDTKYRLQNIISRGLTKRNVNQQVADGYKNAHAAKPKVGFSQTREDIAYMDFMERSQAGRPEDDGQEQYQAWAADQRENGEDDSEDAWLTHLDNQLPEYA